MNILGKAIVSLFLIAISSTVFATAYSVPSTTESLIGETRQAAAVSGDNVITLAKQYDIGYNAIEKANPHLNLTRGFPINAFVQVPTQHLLPNLPREGIVINLPEMRMYYFPADSDQVLTYPIGIGKIGRTIPIKHAVVTRKKKDPIWVPPQSIREFNLQQGIILPRIMPAGPDNPLGQYAIYMSIPTYLIHSSPFIESIGKRASFGCIRMFESDIETFFPSIEKNIPIIITNASTKVGWHNERIYMETHTPLEEHKNAADASLPGMVHLIATQTKNRPVLIDWQMVSYLSQERDGIPHEIGVEIKSKG